MPKVTSEFKHMLDYDEALTGRQKGPVLFGHRQDLCPLYQDIECHQKSSNFYGRVLYPENSARKAVNGGTWDYEKNKAFWAGAIDAGQTFVLVSDLAHYRTSGGTIDEMFWLADNGYRFEPDPQNPSHTIALPPQTPCAVTQIKHYQNGHGNESESMQERLQRVASIRASVLQQRAGLQQGTPPTCGVGKSV